MRTPLIHISAAGIVIRAFTTFALFTRRKSSQQIDASRKVVCHAQFTFAPPVGIDRYHHYRQQQ